MADLIVNEFMSIDGVVQGHGAVDEDTSGGLAAADGTCPTSPAARGTGSSRSSPCHVQQILREPKRSRQRDQVAAGQHVRLDTQPIPGQGPAIEVDLAALDTGGDVVMKS
jgi:hypothetical protein